jgi:hypothetical protein
MATIFDVMQCGRARYSELFAAQARKFSNPRGVFTFEFGGSFLSGVPDHAGLQGVTASAR